MAADVPPIWVKWNFPGAESETAWETEETEETEAEAEVEAGTGSDRYPKPNLNPNPNPNLNPDPGPDPNPNPYDIGVVDDGREEGGGRMISLPIEVLAVAGDDDRTDAGDPDKAEPAGGENETERGRPPPPPPPNEMEASSDTVPVLGPSPPYSPVANPDPDPPVVNPMTLTRFDPDHPPPFPTSTTTITPLPSPPKPPHFTPLGLVVVVLLACATAGALTGWWSSVLTHRKAQHRRTLAHWTIDPSRIQARPAPVRVHHHHYHPPPHHHHHSRPKNMTPNLCILLVVFPLPA